MAAGTIRPETLSEEGRYRFDERLGILCEGGKPTGMQEHLAWREAVEWEKGNSPQATSTQPHKG